MLTNNDLFKRSPLNLMFNNEVIENFLIHHLIGHGAFSEVYAATHMPSKQKVAVKVVNLNSISSDDLVGICRELAVLAQTSHPNIVTLYQYVIQENFLFMFLEYMPGGTLHDKLKIYRKMSEQMAKKFTIDILKSLFYLHRGRSCAHRDIKLQNIMIGSDGSAKLIDFGFANTFKNNLLQTFVGTPGFTAPEIIDTTGYDPKCDIFSLGACLYTIVSGKFPFDIQNTNRQKLIEQIGALEYPDELSTPLLVVLKGMLDPDPIRRITLDGILQSDWINDMHPNRQEFSFIPSPLDVRMIQTIENLYFVRRKTMFKPNQTIIGIISKQGTDTRKIQNDLFHGEINENTAYYFILLKTGDFPENDDTFSLSISKTKQQSVHNLIMTQQSKCPPVSKKLSGNASPLLSERSSMKYSSRYQVTPITRHVVRIPKITRSVPISKHGRTKYS